MNDNQKEAIKKQLSKVELTHRYQQAIAFFLDGAKTGIIDNSEYQTFLEFNVKRDLSAAAHAWLGMMLSFEQYFDIVQAIIGFDLMVQGAIDGQIKAKSNGEDKE